MKLPFILSVFLLFAIHAAQAQPATAQPAPGAVYTKYFPSGKDSVVEDRMQGRRIASDIVTDTVLLVLSRRSTQRGIIMNTTGSITGACQYYGAPQPITLTGFEFFAYKNDNSTATPAIVNAELYEAGGKLPVGSPLYSTTVNVPYSSTTVLSSIRKVVQFPNPITVNTDYVLVLELTNNEEMVVATNNWINQDGDGDYFAGGMFSTGWISGSSINVGNPPIPFDADFFIQPYVRYPIHAGIEVSTHCLTGDDTIAFTNTSSPVFSSKFYNKLAFLDTTLESIFRWDFGDGSPVYHGFEPDPHAYPTIQKYTITKRDSLLQWSFGDRNRLTVETSLNEEPEADFTFNGHRNVVFTNTSKGIDQVTWIFTDSTYSTLENPAYYFFGEGAHDVTLIIENGCGSDTITKTVEIAPIGIEESEALNLTIYPNPASDQLTLSGKDLHRFESIELVDITGRVVLRKTVNGALQLHLPVTELAPGWYLLQGTGTESSFSRPVVLK